MRSLRLVSLVPLFLVAGCARATVPAQTPETLAATVRGPIRSESAIQPASAQTDVASGMNAELRKPGDFVVFRFSGAFRKTPLLLSQRVIAVDRARTTIEVALSSGASAASAQHASGGLRVIFDRTPGVTREVAQVTRIVGEREEPGTLEDYEKLMAETVLVPDRNDDMLGTEVVSTNVGDKSIDVKKTSYRVAIGKKSAVMSTLTSEGFVWGDVGGEIKSDDGKLLYRAEVIETGAADTKPATAKR